MKTVYICILCVFAGIAMLATGYAAGQAVLQPGIDRLQAQVVDLTAQVTGLTARNLSLNHENTRLADTISEQAAALTTSETNRKKVEGDLAAAQQSIVSYKSQVDSLTSRTNTLNTQLSTAQSQVTSVQKHLDTILSVIVTQHYDWASYTWELQIPISLYDEYKERSRPTAHTAWVDMAKDPRDATYINQMVAYVNDQAKKYSFTDTQKLNFVVTFVQSMPYTSDRVTEGMDEYPRYPIETLFDRGGDCEDTSILTAAVLYRMGYDVALVELPGHMAVGVALTSATGRYYQYGGKKYFYLETTGDGWRIGDMPAEFINTSARIYPVS